MIQLYLFECKKIFKQRIICILLVLLTGMSVYLLQNHVEYGNEQAIYLNENNSIMSEEDVNIEIAKAKQVYTGEMNETWFSRLEAEYQVAKYKSDQRFIDFAKMDDTYGKDWYEDYKKNKRSYYNVTTEPSKDAIKPAYYYNEPLPQYKEDIYYDTIASLYVNYGTTMMKNKPWNSEDGTYGTMYSVHDNEPVAMPVYTYNNLTKAEILYLKDIMNEKSFYYGDSGKLFDFLEMLSPVGIFTMLWMILVSSNLINKERSQGSLELLSSTAYGRKRLFFAKVGASITCGILALTSMITAQSIYMFIIGGFGDWNVNISEGLHAISIFTYGEGFLISLIVLILGVFVISILGVTISTFMKSSYVSLVTLAILIVGLNFLDVIHIPSVLFPMGFMDTPAVAVRNFTLSFFGHVNMIWKVLYYFWIPVCIVFVYTSYHNYISKQYDRIS